MAGKISVDEAVLQLRRNPETRQRMEDSFLGEDLLEAARRFAASAEFAEVLRIIGGAAGKAVLDMGAGTGIASYAFFKAGAKRVISLEPDASTVVGRGAIRRLLDGMNPEIVEGVGEALPLPGETVDVVYCRQVLHHTQDLQKVMRESYRVLKPGGVLLACREHVVDDEEQLKEFLANHPIHQLAGGENAFSLPAYTGAIRAAGFHGLRSMTRFDSIISGYPEFSSPEALAHYPVMRLQQKFGKLGVILSKIPGVCSLAIHRFRQKRDPGRLYTFLAFK